MGRTWAKSSKKVAKLDVYERLAVADSVRIEAIRQFEDAAAGLEFAAAEQKELAAEATAEADRLDLLAGRARDAAGENLRAAEKIRSLFS